MDRKWVYLFTELEAAEASAGDWEAVRGLLGGKGANLAEMTRIQVPVSPGFTVTTEACIAYLGVEGEFPADIWEQQIEALQRIEATTEKEFGNPARPLLVSCRSGAKFSMPGMMDTILNLGLNDEVARGMVELTGDARFVYDAYRRLIQMFGTVVRGMHIEVFEQVIAAKRLPRECPRTLSSMQRTGPRSRSGSRTWSGLTPTLPFHRIRWNSCARRPKRCSNPGIGSAP